MDQTSAIHSRQKEEALCAWLFSGWADTEDETPRNRLEDVDNLHSLIGFVVRSYLDDVTTAAALGIRLEEMQNRLARIEARAEKKRLLLTSVMEQADVRDLAEPDFTASLRPLLPNLIVTDCDAVPAIYWELQPPRLDRPRMTAALIAGQTIPGAKLGVSQSVLSVRTS